MVLYYSSVLKSSILFENTRLEWHDGDLYSARNETIAIKNNVPFPCHLLGHHLHQQKLLHLTNHSSYSHSSGKNESVLSTSQFQPPKTNVCIKIYAVVKKQRTDALGFNL